MSWLMVTFLFCGSVGLVWSPSPDSRMTNQPSGYVLVYGTASRVYTGSTNVGNVTNATLTGLPNGVTNYISIFAYASPSLQSDLANEVTWFSTNRPSRVQLPKVKGP